MFLDKDSSQKFASLSFDERFRLAQGKDDSILDSLSLDPDWRIRLEVAKHCKARLLRVMLSNSERRVEVLAMIARRGSKKIQDRLVSHYHYTVRLEIAHYGDIDHCEVLKLDRHPEVARVANSRIMPDLFQ